MDEGYVVMIESQIWTVTEMNKTYALGNMLGINQNLNFIQGERKHYGFNPSGMVAGGGVGTVARQAVSEDS